MKRPIASPRDDIEDGLAEIAFVRTAEEEETLAERLEREAADHEIWNEYQAAIENAYDDYVHPWEFSDELIAAEQREHDDRALATERYYHDEFRSWRMDEPDLSFNENEKDQQRS